MADELHKFAMIAKAYRSNSATAAADLVSAAVVVADAVVAVDMIEVVSF